MLGICCCMLNGLNCRGGRGLKIGGDITTPHTLYETLDVTHTSPFSILNRTSFKIDVALTPPDKKKKTHDIMSHFIKSYFHTWTRIRVLFKVLITGIKGTYNFYLCFINL